MARAIVWMAVGAAIALSTLPMFPTAAKEWVDRGQDISMKNLIGSNVSEMRLDTAGRVQQAGSAQGENRTLISSFRRIQDRKDNVEVVVSVVTDGMPLGQPYNVKVYFKDEQVANHTVVFSKYNEATIDGEPLMGRPYPQSPRYQYLDFTVRLHGTDAAGVLDELEARMEEARENRDRIEYEIGRLNLSGEWLSMSYDDMKKLSADEDKATKDASIAQRWYLGNGGEDPEGFDAFWRKYVRVVVKPDV